VLCIVADVSVGAVQTTLLGRPEELPKFVIKKSRFSKTPAGDVFHRYPDDRVRAPLADTDYL
jgi:hypothetical protein